MPGKPMRRRSSIHRDLRTRKYRPRVVKSKKKKPPRHKPDWRSEDDGVGPGRGTSRNR
jgi:hypothetical protein